MSASARAAKRARTQMDEEPPDVVSLSPTQYKHDDEFWFEDGNIVLVARDTAFRLYRGLLAAQSTIFADMFASSSSRADEVFADCPLVRLSDSPEDLRHFFRVLFPKTRRLFFHDTDEPKPTFNQVSAVIRLAHKYNVEDILRQGLSALKTYYTDDFDLFESEPCTPIEFHDGDAISAVNLAQLTDTPEILPFALYKCCALGGAILDGCKREDGTIDRLDTETLRRCLDGRNALAREAFSIISRVFCAAQHPGCTNANRKVCRHAIQAILTECIISDSASEATVLDSWRIIIREEGKDRNLCDSCIEELVRRELQARKDVWKRLPEIFGITVKGWGDEEAGGAE